MQNTENPYAAPTSKTHDVPSTAEGEKRKLFSPTQGGVGAFFFGPLTALYLVQSNFGAMALYEKRTKTITYGAIFIAAFLLLSPFLPEKIPGFAIGLVYMYITHAVIEKQQMGKQKIVDSDMYEFQSNWLVFGIGLLGLLILTVMLMIILMVYSALGFIEPLW